MIRAIQNGLQGMRNASGLVDAAAGDIAKAGPSAAPAKTSTAAPVQQGTLPQDMVKLMVGRTSYDANARVVEAALETQSTLNKIV